MSKRATRQTDWRSDPIPGLGLGLALQRRVVWVPGFDCRLECEHEPKQNSNHGTHGDELHLQVRASDVAAHLCIYTFARRGEVSYVMGDGRLHMTAGLVYHYGFEPVEDVGARASTDGCEVLGLSRCYLNTNRMLISVAERDAAVGGDRWVWSDEDAAYLDGGAPPRVTHPEVEHLVLAMTTGVWRRMGADLMAYRRAALGLEEV